MHLRDLKNKPRRLVSAAEALGIERVDAAQAGLIFSILKVEAENGSQIMGMGTIEVLPDSFGFLRSHEANYLAGRTTSMWRPTR
jgi:transcription termination factor Rho